MVEYDFFPVPGQDSEEESPRLYPRFVSKETLDLNELINRLDVKYDRATIIGVVTALEDALVHELGNSRSVRLGDIGTFSLHVSGLRPDRARTMLRMLVSGGYLIQSGRLSATRYSKKGIEPTGSSPSD